MPTPKKNKSGSGRGPGGGGGRGGRGRGSGHGSGLIIRNESAGEARARLARSQGKNNKPKHPRQLAAEQRQRVEQIRKALKTIHRLSSGKSGVELGDMRRNQFLRIEELSTKGEHSRLTQADLNRLNSILKFLENAA